MNEDLTLPESLDALTPAELRELHSQFLARITALREQETLTVAEARELRSLVADANTLAETVNEVAQSAPELSDLAPEPPVVDPTTDPVIPESQAAAPEGPDGAPPVVDPAAPPVDPAAHAAGVSAADLGQLPGAGAPPSEENHPVGHAVFRASANQQTVAGGATLELDAIGEVFEDMRRTASGAREMPKSYVASVNRFREDLPEQMRLSGRNSTVANTELINNLPQQPQTAAICGPLDVVRTIPDCVENGRPVRDMFRQIPADRGAFLFQRSVGLADVADGVAEWTDAEQADIDEADPSTWKQCHALVCTDPITAEVDAAFRCLTVDVKQEFSNPEQVQNNISTLSAATDRLAEGMLLRKIDLLSGIYSFTGNYGSIPAFADMISRVVSKGADSIRSTDEHPGYRAILPQGLISRLVVDDLSRGFDDDVDTREVIDAAMRNTGLDSYVITPDPSVAVGQVDPWAAFTLNAPGAASAVLPNAPKVWRVRILRPTDGFFFSTGEIAFGMQRSPELARQNKIQWFGETFEGLDKQGCAPWFTVDVTLCPNGSRAGQIVPVACP